MYRHRKFAAFIMGLVLCASASAYPVSGAFAETTEAAETTAETSAAAEDETAAAEQEDDYITSGDFKYSLTDDDEAVIEGYVGAGGAVTVPETIDGKKVTEIGAEAFYETDAESVHLPAGIEYIADNPFLDSVKLTEITVDDGNENYYAEDGVLFLKRNESEITLMCYPEGKSGDSYTIPENAAAIGASAMYNTQLKELVIPAGITQIYHHGISFNKLLTKVDMSACTGLTRIADQTFAYCTSLVEAVLPPALDEIGGGAFAGCDSLTEITIPETVTLIGQNAFAATGLRKVTVPASVTEIGYCAFGYDEDLNPIDSFTIIGTTGSAAYIYCTDSDDEIGYTNNFTFVDEANADLVNEAGELETLEFGEYLYAEKDGGAYILSCTSISSKIEIPAEINGLPVTCIYGAAFYQNGASEIVIPDTVTRIAEIAFSGCTNLKRINLPAELTEIGNRVFEGCTSLTSIEIPAKVETIGEEVFYGCTGMEEFKVASGSEHFIAEEGVLMDKDKTIIYAYPLASSETYYKAPDTVKEIFISAFAGSKNLQSVDISTAETIGSYAFEDCAALTSVQLGEPLTSLGTCAFYNCDALKAVRTYNNLDAIGTAALGFNYDEMAGEDVLVEDFTIYAAEGSAGANYAYSYEIELETDVSLYEAPDAPAETVEIFGYKIEKTFLWICGGIAAAAAAVLAVLGITKSRKKKKQSGGSNGAGGTKGA